MGIAYADYDQDGWVDFVTGDWGRGYTLYQNQTQINGTKDAAHNWLTVRLVGSTEAGGPVNRDAIGTRVFVHISDGTSQMQEVKSGSSLGAGNETALHFGLGKNQVNAVLILWPDGQARIHNNVLVNQLWTVAYDD